MADRELAAKLAKRLGQLGESQEEYEQRPPPPVPAGPEKVVQENPYVAVDNDFSIDDIVNETLRQKEQNNNLKNNEDSAPPQSPVRRTQKQSSEILSRIESLSKPQPVDTQAPPAQSENAPGVIVLPNYTPDPTTSTAISKRPEVRIEHRKTPTTPVRTTFAKEDDGSELERRLAAQRQKKACPPPPPVSYDPILQEIERLEKATPPRTTTDFIPGVSLPPPPPNFKPPPVPTEELTYPRPSSPPSLPPPPPPLLMQKLPLQLHTTEPVVSLPSVPEMAAPPPPSLPSTMGHPDAPPPPPPPKKSTQTAPLSPPIILTQTNTPVLGGSLSPSSKSTTSTDDSEELSAKLARRNLIIEGEMVPEVRTAKMSVYSEFPQFTRKQIKYFTDVFTKFDEDQDNFIDFMELKRMMEKLGEPQTHITLKQIIKKVDEDQDGKVSLREFLLIFKMAATGELGTSSEVFQQLADSIDVTKEGVHGAANFFEAKIAEQTKLSKFEEEIKQEQEERKAEEEEKKRRRQKFIENKSLWH